MLKTATNFYRITTIGKNKNFLFGFYFLVLTFSCLYVEFYQRYYHINLSSPEPAQIFSGQIFSLLVLLAVCVVVQQNLVDSLFAFFVGTLVMLIGGHRIGFYDFKATIQSINVTTISLMFGMGVASITLTESGVFVLICNKLIKMFGRSNYALFVLLCLFSFVFSLFLNNMVSLMLVFPITGILTRTLKLNILPFIAGEVIASSLGGSSTMLGGFPTYLISTSLKIPFLTFLKILFPICFINLIFVFSYFFTKVDFDDRSREKLVIELPSVTVENPGIVWVQVLILCAMIGLFMISSIHPGLVALCGSFIMYTIAPRHENILEKISYRDIAFFFFFFVFVGGITSSGLPQAVIDFLSYLTFGNKFLLAILFMWVACFVALFMGAGPTSLIFMPFFLGIHVNFSEELLIWSLLLGVCAGSSGTLAGTWGNPALSDFIQKSARRTGLKKRSQISKDYLQYGMPVAYLQLVTSTIYVTILYLMGV
ncbi:MAG: hypothetical protein HQK54_12285 [Oligoflexales bacterium]|nr:hypothetical protein [Oligoflexales bacterium]